MHLLVLIYKQYSSVILVVVISNQGSLNLKQFKTVHVQRLVTQTVRCSTHNHIDAIVTETDKKEVEEKLREVRRWEAVDASI